MVDPLNTKSWVMVPAIPTDEMVAAGGRQQVSDRAGSDSVYRAMISASPDLPAIIDGDVGDLVDRLTSDRHEITTLAAKAISKLAAAESRVLSLEEALRNLAEAVDCEVDIDGKSGVFRKRVIEARATLPQGNKP